MARPDFDRYMMNIAREASARATCDRKHVGAVLVQDKVVTATGYNGSPVGMKHCDEVGHMMEDGHCVRTTHAEANAIIQAGRPLAKGGTIYTTASPCWQCFKLIVNVGIKKIVYAKLYRDERITEFAKEAGIELQHLETAEGHQ